MTAILVILGACFLVSGIVGVYAYVIYRQDADEYNKERGYKKRDSGQS